MSLPRIGFTTPVPKRAQQFDKAKWLYDKSLADGGAQNVLRFVEAELQTGRTDVVGGHVIKLIAITHTASVIHFCRTRESAKIERHIFDKFRTCVA